MDRTRFIHYRGVEILFLDFSRCSIEDASKLIEAAEEIIRSRPLRSLRTLTDVTDVRFDQNLTRRMKEFTAHNKPYVQAAAVVGISGLKKILFEAVMHFSGRKLHAFESIEDAKSWLARN